MRIFIQHMVSLRCKLLVKSILERMQIAYTSVELGEVRLSQHLSADLAAQLSAELHKSGLELMHDKKAVLIEKIINVVVEWVHYSDDLPRRNFSDILSQKLQLDYHKLSELFSSTKGMTIEHFIILHKIERVKELIIYDELSLTEISYRMHYSSVAHLSRQFKQITGLTPTLFKNLSQRKRKNLEFLSKAEAEWLEWKIETQVKCLDF
ncbi:MAG: helix-turn-helix domain-containing protein [Bacteroidota bacterium]